VASVSLKFNLIKHISFVHDFLKKHLIKAPVPKWPGRGEGDALPVL
jgi:hypothetical protein